jgi:hypothetical protein
MKRTLLALSAAVASFATCLALTVSSSAALADRVPLTIYTQGFEGTLALSTPQGWSSTCTVVRSGKCSLDTERGQVMTVVPTGTAASPFLRWDGSVCAMWTPSCTFTMSDARSFTVYFSARLVLPAFGRGYIGWETSDGSKAEAYKCSGWTGSDYCAVFPYGAKLRLRANASAGWHTSRWGGTCEKVSPSSGCLFTMDANRVATATFDADTPVGQSCGPNRSCDPVTVTVPFTVKIVGAGSVAAASVRTVGAKTCDSYTTRGYVCTSFAALRDTWLELKAVPGPGARFLGWSGLCYGNGTCRFKTSKSWQTLTAQFG